jgi:hypothetical protein
MQRVLKRPIGRSFFLFYQCPAILPSFYPPRLAATPLAMPYRHTLTNLSTPPPTSSPALSSTLSTSGAPTARQCGERHAAHDSNPTPDHTHESGCGCVRSPMAGCRSTGESPWGVGIMSTPAQSPSTLITIRVARSQSAQAVGPCCSKLRGS